jgi:hypothetical protein
VFRSKILSEGFYLWCHQAQDDRKMEDAHPERIALTTIGLAPLHV